MIRVRTVSQSGLLLLDALPLELVGAHHRQLKADVSLDRFGGAAHHGLEHVSRVYGVLGERRDRCELLEADAHHLGQQRLLGREVAVDGADPDAGVRGDLVHLRLGAVAREQLAARGHDALAVASGVGSECALSGGHDLDKRNLSSVCCYKQEEP